MDDDAVDKIAAMMADGFDHYDHEFIKVGMRVRNAGELYAKAHREGTAEVIAVMRKPGVWETTYNRKNIEVLVRRDRDGSLTWWADYGTRIAKEQPDG